MMMNWKYKVDYVENEKTIGDMYKIHRLRSVNLSARVLPACITIIALYVSWRAGFMTGGQGSVPMFWLKFILGIAILFGLGEVYSRTFGKSGSVAEAEQKAKEIYAKRRKLGEVRVEFKFYEDYCETISKMEDAKFAYVNVRSMFETEDMIGLTVINDRNQKLLYGIPKAAMKRCNIEWEEMKKWLEEKCTSAKKGFIQLEY